MSTRSVIIRYNSESGNFETAYKHHDGYANTGILNLFYNTPEKAEAFLNAIMKPGVELRTLAPTLEACSIETNDYYGYSVLASPLANDKPEKYLPRLIHHGDAEYITLYTPHGWKEFPVIHGSFFKEKQIQDEEDLAWQERMRKNNAELVALWHHVKALAAGAPMPSAQTERLGESRWAYLYGDKALKPEEKLYPLGSKEALEIQNTIANELLGCNSANAWQEFVRCTNAKLLFVHKCGEVCFKINPRLMKNKANVVKVYLNPDSSYGQAEFFKVSTTKTGKKIQEISCHCAGYARSHSKRNTFLEIFREFTALQTHFPAFSSGAPVVPAWSIEEQTGYKPIANYWQQLYRAAHSGIDDLKRIATGLFHSAKHSYKHLTEFVMALNWLSFEWVEKNEPTARLFCNLFRSAEDYARQNLTGEELEYYFRITD